MKYSLVALFLFIAPVAHAFSPVMVEVGEPFEEIVIPMDEAGQKQSYLGILDNFPHLFEFAVTETSEIQVQLRQKGEPNAYAVNLILLSVDPDTKRISEIIRVNEPYSLRSERYMKERGISLVESEMIEQKLKPGLYRLEVSTAVNRSAYELDFGIEENSAGYFGNFGSIASVQSHFGFPWYRFFFSTYVLYQIGILLVLGGIGYTWYRQKHKKESSDVA